MYIRQAARKLSTAPVLWSVRCTYLRKWAVAGKKHGERIELRDEGNDEWERKKAIFFYLSSHKPLV